MLSLADGGGGAFLTFLSRFHFTFLVHPVLADIDEDFPFELSHTHVPHLPYLRKDTHRNRNGKKTSAYYFFMTEFMMDKDIEFIRELAALPGAVLCLET